MSYPDYSLLNPIQVSFRDLVPEIKDTGYLTHSLFYYPARFIPQVPRFCLNAYTKPGDWVIDPFAGSGTVGLEAVLAQRNAILVDINPLLNHIVPTKINFNDQSISAQVLERMLNAMFQASNSLYRPLWNNIEYWYEPEILEVLCRYWGWVKSLEKDPYRPIIEVALLKASKYFSNAEHKTPKLFRSRSKKKFIQQIMSSDWDIAIKNLIRETALDACQRIIRLMSVRPTPSPSVIYQGGMDSSDPEAWKKLGIQPYLAKAVITSPPYLQAQEYIRTAKLELYWLGHSEEEVRALNRLEIPYRPTSKVIYTPSIEQIKQQINRSDLNAILDSYFYYTLTAIENASSYLAQDGILCVFVGTPKINGIDVEIWRAFVEYFTKKNFSLEVVYEDKIKRRQLFGNRKNKNPDGMKSEFLIVMKKI